MVNQEDMFGVMEAKEDKRVNVKDILDFVFKTLHIEQKTILSNDNINAIIKMQAVNRYLKNYYGFELDLYKGLISDKRVNVISLNGRGRNDIIDAVKAMQDNNVVLDDKKTGII